jgi:type I restriction enzyme M protein
MNADEFRDYILGFIFYKYLSEKMNIFADEILKQNEIQFNKITNPKERYGKENDFGSELIEAIKEEALEKLGYFLRPEELFTEVAKRGKGENEDDVEKFDESKTNFILEDLQKILINIQLSTMGTDSEEDYENLFEDMDLNSSKLGKTPEARNAIIAKVLTHLDKIDFKLEHTELDILGDAYEYLIGQFASGAGKTAGEFYTPQEVSKILAKIVTTGKSKLKSVYDPTCGSGSLLLRVAREVEDVSNFYGQEMNRTTYNLARMNMILHGVHYRQFDIKQDDTLEHPQHIDKQFEAIVANPPFSAQWSANPLFTSDDRFSQYGKLAPSNKADFAFLQHMIYHLADNGTMAIILPHGTLFRGGAEQHIRKYLIENKNFLDAVIGLPANIFYGTGIATSILVFKKCRENPEDILFIDASLEFEKNKNKNILKDVHINKIIDTYRNRKEIDKFSTKASLEKVKSNDFNLNITRYISNSDIETLIDISVVIEQLKENKLQSYENDKLISKYCEILRLPFPDGNNVFLLNEFKKGVLQNLLSQVLRFKQDDNTEFPEWTIKKISECLDYEQPTNYLVSSTDYEDIFETPVVTAGKTFILGYTNEKSGIFNENLPVIIFDDFTTACQFVDFPFKAKSSAMKILTAKNGYDIKFMFEILQNIKYVPGAHGRHWISVFANLEVEVPTYDEQVKIGNFINSIDKRISLIQEIIR